MVYSMKQIVDLTRWNGR